MRCLAVSSLVASLSSVAALSTGAAAATVETYGSGVAAAAGRGAVDGTVLYKIIDAASKTPKPLGACLLQHGYVVSQAALDGYADPKRGSSRFDLFVRDYFSKAFVDALVDGPCASVVVAIQEAILTSTLEMTRRTEAFLRDVVCRGRSCALFGHSKGGAVATSIARRCMETTSELGEEGCDKLRRVYSASGNNLGATYGAIIYGLYLDDPDGLQLKLIEFLAQAFHIDIEVTDPTAMAYVPGETNPMWVDISPVAPMEDGVPIAVKNDVRLERDGWLTGFYAAGDSAYDFDGERGGLYGCGSPLYIRSYKACTVSGATMTFLHQEKMRPALERGVAAWKTDARFADPTTGGTGYLDGVTWRSHQVGDGMADFALSMAPCRRGGSAVVSCTTFKASNHTATAGSGPEVTQDVLRFFGAEAD